MTVTDWLVASGAAVGFYAVLLGCGYAMARWGFEDDTR